MVNQTDIEEYNRGLRSIKIVRVHGGFTFSNCLLLNKIPEEFIFRRKKVLKNLIKKMLKRGPTIDF